MAMTTSAAGRAKLAQREGNKLVAYQDSVGVWTIGVGHTAAAGQPVPKKGMRITAAESDEILSRDLAIFERSVNRAVKTPLTQNQFDALVSLAFNIGGRAFAKSTLVKKLNNGDIDGAAAAFMSWNKGTVAGALKVIPGLTKRRKQERKQFITGLFTTPPLLTPVPTAPLTSALKVDAADQERLLELGYSMVGQADGKPGPRTAAGITAFQRVNGLPTTGELDARTSAVLHDDKAKALPVAFDRAVAKASDVAKMDTRVGSVVRDADRLVKGGIGGLVGLPVIGTVLEYVQSAKDTLTGIPAAVWIALACAVFGLVIWYALAIRAKGTAAHRVGETA